MGDIIISRKYTISIPIFYMPFSKKKKPEHWVHATAKKNWSQPYERFIILLEEHYQIANKALFREISVNGSNIHVTVKDKTGHIIADYDIYLSDNRPLYAEGQILGLNQKFEMSSSADGDDSSLGER